MQERPELPLHLHFLWDAWWLLSSDRPIGMAGAGPIGFSAMDRYASRFGIEGRDEFEAFAVAIQRLDDVYLDWQSKRGKGDAPSA